MALEEFCDGFGERDWQELTEGGPVRFAMIGLGWWTVEEAIPAVAHSKFCTTTVLVSSSAEKAASHAESVETVEHALSYDQFHEGKAADAYDAVYICTPNALHLEYAETAARLGKDVLCEKPMEVDVERARRMVDACDDGGVTLMVAYRMHTEPAVRRLRELVADGFIGDPVQVHGHMSQRLLEMIPDENQWRLREELSGGATLMDIGLYPLNTTRFVLGADPTSAQGRMASTNEAFSDVPDEFISFQLQFPDDVSGVYTASQNAHRAGHLRVVGTEGEATFEPAFSQSTDRHLRLSRGGTTLRVDFEPANQMIEEFDYFAHCLLDGTEPHADGRHGLVDMLAMDAVYEAAETGETTPIPEE